MRSKHKTIAKNEKNNFSEERWHSADLLFHFQFLFLDSQALVGSLSSHQHPKNTHKHKQYKKQAPEEL
jgi:hypothetical protein